MTLDASIFSAKKYLYGSEIGSWDLQDGRFDGHYMLNYGGLTPTCPALAVAAKIPVVRWACWDTFTDVLSPSGIPGVLPRDQFDNVVNGIHAILLADPLIKLNPIRSDGPNFCPDSWGYINLLGWYKTVVAQAGSRVQLYEVANEPDLDCWSGLTPAQRGINCGNLWINTVPALRKYARVQGFEIFVGGPGTTTTDISADPDTSDLAILTQFLQTIRNEYDNPVSVYHHDRDLIPSFVSFHMYGVEYVANVGGISTPLDAIPYYGVFIDSVKAQISSIWEDVALPPVAISEWNVGGDSYLFPEPLSAQYYTQFLQMLRAHGVWLACQFLMASNNNGMDMITEAGSSTPYYDAFKVESLANQGAVVMPRKAMLVRTRPGEYATSPVLIDTVKAQGTLTIAVQPIAADTITVGATTYTFRAAAAAPGDIALGLTATATLANVAAAINGDAHNAANATVAALAPGATTLVLQAKVAGTGGNAIVTTSVFTSGSNHFDAATLGTTQAGALGDVFDNTDGMTLGINGRTGLSIENPTSGALTVTCVSAPGPPEERLGDLVAVIPAGTRAVFQEFPVAGWNSGGGNLMNVDASGPGLLYLAEQRAPGT